MRGAKVMDLKGDGTTSQAVVQGSQGQFELARGSKDATWRV